MKFRTSLTLTGLLLVACHTAGQQTDSHDGHSHDTPHVELHDSHADHSEADHADHIAPQQSEGGSDEIIFPAEKARAAGVEVGTAEAGPFRAVIPASGTLLAAPGDGTTVVANVAGVVTFPSPITEGLYVEKGAPLLCLSSARLQDGDPAARARIAYETARAEYERAGELVKERIVSQKDFEAARAAYETARIAYEAFARSGSARGTLVEAPAAGYVGSLLVGEGDYVTVGTPLMTLSRNSRLWLRADVPARYAAELASATAARFRPLSEERVYGLDEVNGRRLAYGRSVEAGSAYLSVTFQLDNPGSLVPGLFTEVWLLGEERPDVISLPVTALTEEQGIHYVYIQLDEECYRKQPVECGATDGVRVEITAGLAGGERVVTAGAVHVRLAGAADAIPGHTHNH